MRVLVIEDEAAIAQRLRRLLAAVLDETYSEVECDIAQTLEEGALLLEQQPYDLVTLDLNLHGNSGFDLLTLACSKPSHTIIVSAYRDQAISAFEYGVLDFVPKPFSRQRLAQAVERYNERHNALAAERGTRYLVVKNGAQLKRLTVDEVESIQGYGNYARVYLENGQECLHEKGLDTLLSLLPEQFVRIHKSHILNLQHLDKLDSLGGGKYQVTTLNGTVLPVGRSKIDALRAHIITR